MLVLCGLPISNYYNKVKLALLEKGVAFSEEGVDDRPKRRGACSRASPLGKIPFMRTDRRARCARARRSSSTSRRPGPSRRCCRPIRSPRPRCASSSIFVDLHLELVARELYPKAFFGGTVSDGQRAHACAQLLDAQHRRLQAPGALRALRRRRDSSRQADCAAWASLPVVAMATKAVYGEDLLAAAGIDLKGYQRFVGERPSAQRVTADRKAWQERAAAKA